MYEKMLLFVQNYFLDKTPENTHKPNRGFVFRDRFLHIRRVVNTCQTLLRSESANHTAVLVAAIFHDVGYAFGAQNHALTSSKICYQYLLDNSCEVQQSFNIKNYDAFIKQVVSLVENHSNKKTTPNPSPELAVLMDADMLDEIGALSVVFDVYEHALKLHSVDSYQQILTNLQQLHQNLSQNSTLLKSNSGKREYQLRLEIIQKFIEQLQYELQMFDL